MTLPLKDALLMTFSGEWGDESKDTSGVFVLRTTNFTNSGDVSYENVVTRNVSNDKISRKRLKPGDIVLEKSGGTKTTPVGRVVYFDNPEGVYLCNNFTQVLRPNTDLVDGKYLFYALYAKYQFHETDRLYNKTTGIQNLQLGRYLDLLIPVPKLMEQRNIREQLDILHDAIAKRREILKKIDDLVKSQFIEMFGDLRKNPKGWCFIPLGKVCDVRDGTHDSPKYCSEGYPLLTSKNFTDGEVDFTDANFISEKDFVAINQRSRVDVGDIVMPMIGTIGHPVIINTSRPFAIKNVALIKFAKSEFLNVFIREILKSDYFLAIISSKNRGNTQKFIALGDIRAIEIPQVPHEMQEQFARFVEQIDKSKIPCEMEVAA